MNKQFSLRMDRLEKSQNDMALRKDDMENILSKFANSQERGRFPSQPQQNLGDIHRVAVNEGILAHMEEIKDIMTLRSGKKVKQPSSPLLLEEEDA